MCVGGCLCAAAVAQTGGNCGKVEDGSQLAKLFERKKYELDINNLYLDIVSLPQRPKMLLPEKKAKRETNKAEQRRKQRRCRQRGKSEGTGRGAQWARRLI